ncbi:MAG: argininosuccinate lyase, partial [Cyanobacteria bacterium J06627_32]
MTSTQQTWSDRFESALHPVVAQFNASIGFDIALLECDLTGSIAHAKMLTKVGLLSDAECEQIVSGLETIRQEYRAGKFNPG